MAQGGPYSEQARTGFDPALAQAAATDPAMAVVGADQGGATTRRTPQIPIEQQPGAKQFSLGVDAPMYGWSLNQDDLGQGDVQYSRTDQFVTPVAEQKLPFGAIAARQQATSTRRQKLEAAKAQALKDFDPYKGISDPAAQHSYAFSNYLNKSAWPSFVQGVQDGLGTTREGAIDYITNDPQGRIMTRQWAQQQDAIAKESAGMTKRSLDTLARIAEGKTELPKEDQEALVRYVNNADENDIPQQGRDHQEFLRDARMANEAISLVQFQDQFLNDFEQFAQQRIQLGKAKRLPGGRYELTEEEWQQFEPYKEAMTEQAVQLGIKGGNREAIQEHLDKIIQNKVERKTRGWDAPRPTSSSGSGNESRTWTGGIERGRSAGIIEEGAPNPAFTPGGSMGATLKKADVERKPVGEIVSGRNQNMGPRSFVDSRGEPVTLKPRHIVNDGYGNLYVEGEVVGDGQVVTFTTIETDENGNEKEVTKTVDTSKKPETITLSLRGNESTADRYFDKGWNEGFTSKKMGGTSQRPSTSARSSDSSIEDLLKLYGQ